MPKLIKIIFTIIFLAGLILGLRYFLNSSNTAPQTAIQELKDEILPPEPETFPVQTDANSRTASQATATLPGKILIDVPFTSQAPYGVWDVRHEEACEEASLIMIHAYLSKKELTQDKAEKEIQAMIDFEIKTYGDYKDTNMEQNIKLYNSFYGQAGGGKKLEPVYDFKKEAVREELAKGNPIIMPAAGRELGNPYYTAPGPLYHNLVLTGYSGNQIITNDPGTRRGQDYRYDIDALFNAIHDFPGDLGKIDQGKKAMIVIRNGG